VLAAAVLCVVAAVLVSRLATRSSVAAGPVFVTHVDGGSILEGGYVSELGGAGVQLHFNEGSRFMLAPGARGRLRAVTADGARFALDHGTASFQITPNAERRWWVEAGPFEVAVRGTDFTVVWDPTNEELKVKLRRGRVTVSGPIVGDELALRPGQDLTVNLPKRETQINEGRTEAAAQAGAQSAAPPNGTVPPGERSSALPVVPSAPASASLSAGTTRRWREALAKGEWDRILSDVEHEGVEASLRALSSDDLFALADAARYRRRPDLARAALLAQRERFPNSSRALDAIFLLGRVEESRAGGKIAAIHRYDEYLARAPTGTYAAEALGRKMILVKDAEGPNSARRVADEYLARFPGGSYAEAARTLQRAQ
jgi:TolA-binding protein